MTYHNYFITEKSYFTELRNNVFISIFLFFQGIIPVMAQDYDVFTSYGINEGLPQSSIWSIVQDKHGFLWLGTADGICRFDGYNFTVYRSEPGKAQSMMGGYYFRFYVDKKDQLWVISKNGIGLYDDAKDQFKTLFYYDEQYPLDNFNCIFGEDSQDVWAGIASCGMLRISKQTHEITVLKETGYKPPTTFRAWQNGCVSNGKIWIASSDAQCCVYDIATSKMSFPAVPDIYAIANFNDSTIVATSDNGLLLLKKKDCSYMPAPVSIPIRERASMKVAFVLPDNQLIAGSPSGLLYINKDLSSVSKAIYSFSRGRRRSYANVQCIYRDRSGNIWVGTNGDGLKKIAAPNKKFRLFSSFNDSSNLVKAISVDNNRLFVGYFGNGLDVFDRQKGFIKNIPLRDPAPLKHIYALAAADSNTLLLNMNNDHFVYSYTFNTQKQASLLPVIAKEIPRELQLANDHAFFLKEGNGVYTGIGDHLFLLDVSDPGNIRAGMIHRFNGQVLNTVFKDSRKRLWVGCISGAFLLDGALEQRIDLPGAPHVKSINEDPDGNIWIGTVKGIYVLDDQQKILHHYTEENGLSNHFIYGILRDDDDNMWFSHNKGLTKYNFKTKRFRHYTVEDGLQSNEFNTGAYFKAEDGTLFFGGINGTNGFNPREINDNPHAPVVVITGIKLFDKPLASDSSYWNTHTIELPYNENSLTFDFAALEFTNPAQNQYTYKMEGMDKEWINAGNIRFARYPSLPPGDYVFKVKAANNDGLWQEHPTIVNVHIVPPFWQLLWFRILCGLVILSMVAGIVAWWQKQRDKKRLRALELQQKIQTERERISRDLHDTVGTQLSLISNNIEWVQHPLKTITENEKSEKLKMVSLMARDIIATLRETIWALKKEQISLEEFSDKLKMFLQKQWSIYPEITLDFSEILTSPVILGPSEALNLFRICQEAIANALKYSGADKISVSVSCNENSYAITITDNGCGFDPEAVDPYVHSGLENIKYRAADIGAQLEIRVKQGDGTGILIAKNNASDV